MLVAFLNHFLTSFRMTIQVRAHMASMSGSLPPLLSALSMFFLAALIFPRCALVSPIPAYAATNFLSRSNAR